jgi:hypothetical protein
LFDVGNDREIGDMMGGVRAEGAMITGKDVKEWDSSKLV